MVSKNKAPPWRGALDGETGEGKGEGVFPVHPNNADLSPRFPSVLIPFFGCTNSDSTEHDKRRSAQVRGDPWRLNEEAPTASTTSMLLDCRILVFFPSDVECVSGHRPLGGVGRWRRRNIIGSRLSFCWSGLSLPPIPVSRRD